MSRWVDNHSAMKVIVYRAFIVTVTFIQPIRLCCRSQVSLRGPILRLSVPAFNQVGRLLNRFDILICGDLFDHEYLYEFLKLSGSYRKLFSVQLLEVVRISSSIFDWLNVNYASRF